MSKVFDPWEKAQNLAPLGEHTLTIKDVKGRHVATNDKDAIDFKFEMPQGDKIYKGQFTRWLSEDSEWKLAVDLVSSGAVQKGEKLPYDSVNDLARELGVRMKDRNFRVKVTHREHNGRKFHEITFIPQSVEATAGEGNLDDLFA